MKDVNLKAMLTIKQDFGTVVGYSDHTKGIEVPIAAVALGAQVIESISLLIEIWLVLTIKPLWNHKN